MSASINEVYNAFCAHCCEGAGTFDDWDDAKAWADQHNDEYHGGKP